VLGWGFFLLIDQIMMNDHLGVEFCEDLGIEWAMGMKGMGWIGMVFQYVFYTRPPTGDSNAFE